MNSVLLDWKLYLAFNCILILLVTAAKFQISVSLSGNLSELLVEGCVLWLCFGHISSSLVWFGRINKFLSGFLLSGIKARVGQCLLLERRIQDRATFQSTFILRINVIN